MATTSSGYGSPEGAAWVGGLVHPGRLLGHVRAALFGGRLYDFSLGHARPRALTALPVDTWPGDADQGALIVAGTFAFHGEVVASQAPQWEPIGVDIPYLTELHSFDWLRDVRAVGGDDARRRTRVLVQDWIDRYDRWHPLAWRPDIIGRRIAAWLGAHEFFCASADDRFRRRVYASLARQFRHLERSQRPGNKGVGEIRALKGLIFGYLALGDRSDRCGGALAQLANLLVRQILPDGGHVQRNPGLLMAALRDLIDLRGALQLVRGEVPEPIHHGIERMTPALRFFRLGDHRLAQFNGTGATDPVMIDAVLARADARGRPLKNARHSGFRRVAAGRTLMLIDVGGPPPHGYDQAAHAAPGAFEMSVGRDRFVVNCGPWPGETHSQAGQDWQEALRSSAAHSTLTLGEANPFPLRRGGGVDQQAEAIASSQQEHDGATLIELDSPCYVGSFDIEQRRRIFVAAAGDDIRGEDHLTPRQPGRYEGGHSARVRFHLHPSVVASLIRDGDEVLMKLPGGHGWRFRCQGGELTLEDSPYFGDGEYRRARQIVVSAETGAEGLLLRWRFNREARSG